MRPSLAYSVSGRNIFRQLQYPLRLKGGPRSKKQHLTGIPPFAMLVTGFMKTPFHTLLLFLLLASTALGRLVRDYSYKELAELSDLVVIAQAVTNQETKDQLTGYQDPDRYAGINTTFAVKHVFQSSTKTGTNIVVLHFNYSDKVQMIANGALFVRFRTQPLRLERSERILREPGETQSAPMQSVVSLPAPEYLLFLKRRADGRYEPVTGFYDARLSVREVGGPAYSQPFEKEIK